MKNVPVVDATSKEVAQQNLPSQFAEPVRPDLILRGVVAIQNNTRQPYGAKIGAGMRASAQISRRRRDYKGSYGMGISRVPRKILSRNGRRFNWVGAYAPGTVKGRRAHPPQIDKIWDKKLNIKERRKMIRSALAATVDSSWVAQHGHKVPKNYPIALANSFESMQKTKDVFTALSTLGLGEELERIQHKTIRAGRGKMRGRKYQKKKGPLIVVSADCPLLKACRNIPGIDVVIVSQVNVGVLAPGAKPGRLTLFTQAALQQMEQKKLFM